MIGSPLRRLGRRALLLGLVLAVVSAVPGVAIASLPAHPAPAHRCCASDAPAMPGADCGSAPCCIVKPAPRAPSVLTGGAAPTALASALVALLEPALPMVAATEPSPVPRARSAPLFVLFAAFLN